MIPATAALYEEANARHVAIRQTARKAIIELQDDRSLRLALHARPRPQTMYAPGTYVAYWRSQKWSNGVLDQTCRWHGPAVVLGYVGRNLVVVRKRQIFRCAPEQVRGSTESELKLVETPNMDLLGIKHFIEKGALESKQYVDLVSEPYPGPASVPSEPIAQQSLPVPAPPTESEPTSVAERQVAVPTEPSAIAEGSSSTAVPSNRPSSSEPYPAPTAEASSSSSYGPMRRRVTGKAGEASLFRPGPVVQEDFSDLMKEIVPRLVEETIQAEQLELDEHRGTKRGHDVADPSELPSVSKSLRTQSPDRTDEGNTFASDEVEVLSAEQCSSFASDQTDRLDTEQIQELKQMWDDGCSIEILVAHYMQKKASKELPVSGHEPSVQVKIDEAKLIEWNTIVAKHAARIVCDEEADNVRRKCPKRIMGSRYVITVKQEEDAPPRMKARWCLQGHLDPDLMEKASHGDFQSPTLSQIGRNLLFQLLSSHRWRLKLGDIRGAFLSAGPLPSRYRPLYAKLPPGGIPGIPDNALIEILGHVYGLNDSPSAWFRKMCLELRQAGFEQSRFDPCLFYMREHGKLTGIYGIHVDDCATGGVGEKYERGLRQLQANFEFRKWREGDGDFCGANYSQCEKTFQISMSQEKFTQKIRPLHFSRDRLKDKQQPLNEKEIGCLRAINGSLNWLATQSRPDLSTQVSFSQQSFPQPTIADGLAANQAVRRARQHADQKIAFKSIPIDQLALMCHSDAAFANAKA